MSARASADLTGVSRLAEEPGIMALVAEKEAEFIGQRTRDGLAAAKRRGIRRGNPRPALAVKSAVEANILRADVYAETLMPAIEEIRRAHVNSLREIARCLNARGFKTPNGRAFAAQSVNNIVADRHSKRTIMFYTQTGMMVLAFVFAALVGSGHIQPWHILVLATLGGVAMAFDMPARQAFMVEMTSRQDLMNAVSLNSSIVNGARVVGPGVAGFVMAQVGLMLCFLLNGLSFIAVLIGLMMMRLPRFVPPTGPASMGRHMLEGFAYVAGHRPVRTLLLLFSVVGVFGWSYSVLLT